MKQSIHTKYHDPTDFKGSRIIARCEGGSAIHPYDYALDAWENHREAFRKLCGKMGWTGKVVSGGHNRGYCWVWVDQWSTTLIDGSKV